MQVFDKLSQNQVEALGKPCRKCSTGTYRERHGRYGPWVQCDNWQCRAKVYRPRGRSFPSLPPRESSLTPEELEAVFRESERKRAASTQQVLALDATPEAVEAAIVKHIVPTINGRVDKLIERVDQNASATLRQVEVNANAVLSVITDGLAELKAAQPQVVQIKRVDGETVKVENGHYLLPRLLKLLGAGFNLYLWGPAGSGKTTAALQAAEALGRGGEIDTLDPTTFRSMVQGYMTPQGEPVHTAFSRCWTEGKTYIPDETDNAPGHVQTLFNSALANHHAPLAWGNVKRTDGFGFVGTGNTPGRPTREFPDRKPMSAAFADRLYFIHWPLDPAIECRAAGLPIPARQVQESKPCTPKAWVTFVRALREWATVNMPTLMVTPRASLIGIQALALGESPLDVAHGLIFRGADQEMVTKALNAVKLP